MLISIFSEPSAKMDSLKLTYLNSQLNKYLNTRKKWNWSKQKKSNSTSPLREKGKAAFREYKNPIKEEINIRSKNQKLQLYLSKVK